MTKFIVLAIGATLFAAAATAAPASTSAPAAQGPSGTYYWLHPKLGMVKVDRATNFMVTAKRPATKPAQHKTQDDAAVAQ